jgi:hypothetical protein
MRAAAVLFFGVAVAGCGGPLDVVTELVDLRVLGMKAEPPEILLDAPAAMDMRFAALVVDPRGGAIDYTWSFCPVDSSSGCMDYEEKREAAGPQFRAALDTLRAISMSGTASPLNEVEPQDPANWWAVRGLWPHAVEAFAFATPFDSSHRPPDDLFSYHLATNGLGFGLGSWPSAILDATKAGAVHGKDVIKVEKRVVVAIQHLRAAALLAQSMSQGLPFRVCADGQTSQDDPDCVDVRDPIANTNPVFERVQVSPGRLRKNASWTDVAVGAPGNVAGVVEVRAGESIRVLPIFTAASYQPYQIIKADFVDSRLFAEDRIEEISVSWFSSAGHLDDPLTWPKFSIALDTAWTAPAAPPPETNGRATLYMVARDQRGGEEWMSLEVQVLP